MNRHARRAYSRNLCQIIVLIEFLRPRMYEFKNSGLGLIVSVPVGDRIWEGMREKEVTSECVQEVRMVLD